MDFTLIPNVVSEQTIRSLSPDDSARAAAQVMLDHDISAIVVLNDATDLVGIVTERDLARRVVAAGHNGDDLTVTDVMTENPATLHPQDSPFDALELMRDRRIRHVPLVDAGNVVGIISIRDLRHAIATLPREKGGSFWSRLLGG